MGLLDNKVVIVTGAGGGIGRSHALACARAGARVLVNDLGSARDGTGSGSELADRVVAEIAALGGDALASSASVTDVEGCDAMVAAALDRWGRVDGLVNNAGILRDATFAKMSTEDWDAVIDVHLTGARNMVRASLDALRVRGGAIVNTTSYSGMIGNFGQSNYAAAKAGIYGFTRVLALELRKYDIRANCVAPVAKTRMTDDIPLVDDAWRPEQVSPVVLYLLSELARGMSGQVFGVQGRRIHLYEVKTNLGCELRAGESWTAEGIAESIGQIVAWDSEGPALIETRVVADSTLLTDDTQAAPSRSRPPPIGKRYNGGFWLVDRRELQAYADAIDDPNPAYRGPDAIAPPMYHVRPFIRLMLLLASDPELDLDLLRLVHGEHAMHFRRPLRHGEVLQLRGTLEAVQQKPSGRIATFGLYGMVDGEIALEGTTTYFIRSEGQPASGRRSTPAAQRPLPSWTHEQRVAEDQAVRYAAASGDDNPIHLDEATAQAAGLPRTILHGLCTLSFAQRDLVDRFCSGDPTRLTSLAVRFARPVFPGDTLTLKVWESSGNTLSFETENQAGEAVMVNGRAVVK